MPTHWLFKDIDPPEDVEDIVNYLLSEGFTEILAPVGRKFQKGGVLVDINDEIKVLYDSEEERFPLEDIERLKELIGQLKRMGKLSPQLERMEFVKIIGTKEEDKKEFGSNYFRIESKKDFEKAVKALNSKYLKVEHEDLVAYCSDVYIYPDKRVLLVLFDGKQVELRNVEDAHSKFPRWMDVSFESRARVPGSISIEYVPICKVEVWCKYIGKDTPLSIRAEPLKLKEFDEVSPESRDIYKRHYLEEFDYATGRAEY